MSDFEITCVDMPGLIAHKPKRRRVDDPTAVRCSGCGARYDTDFYVTGEPCPSCGSELRQAYGYEAHCEDCGVRLK